MAGLGVEVANKQAGISVLGQASITDRWSFGFGVKTLIVNNEMYNDEDDFHHRKGKDFRQVYGQGNGDTSSIQDIHTHNTLVQIPLAVSYTLPIKNNFGFVFSAGTDLDIYARQVIEYGHFNPGLPEPPKREWSEVRVPALAFNNAVISAGVQKRWGHFVAQLSPYVCPQLTQVVYKKEDFYAGLRFRLFYSFGG